MKSIFSLFDVGHHTHPHANTISSLCPIKLLGQTNKHNPYGTKQLFVGLVLIPLFDLSYSGISLLQWLLQISPKCFVLGSNSLSSIC